MLVSRRVGVSFFCVCEIVASKELKSSSSYGRTTILDICQHTLHVTSQPRKLGGGSKIFYFHPYRTDPNWYFSNGLKPSTSIAPWDSSPSNSPPSIFWDTLPETNIAGWKMGAPDWVDVIPSLNMVISQQSLCDRETQRVVFWELFQASWENANPGIWLYSNFHIATSAEVHGGRGAQGWWQRWVRLTQLHEGVFFLFFFFVRCCLRVKSCHTKH